MSVDKSRNQENGHRYHGGHSGLSGLRGVAGDADINGATRHLRGGTASRTPVGCRRDERIRRQRTGHRSFSENIPSWRVTTRGSAVGVRFVECHHLSSDPKSRDRSDVQHRPMSTFRPRKRASAAVAVAAAVLAVTLVPIGAVQAEPNSHGGSLGSDSTTITLITGDRVTVTPEDGKAAPMVTPAPGRESVPIQLRDHDGSLYVVPADAARLIAAGTLDRRPLNQIAYRSDCSNGRRTTTRWRTPSPTAIPPGRRSTDPDSVTSSRPRRC